jgi:hypothetical protein
MKEEDREIWVGKNKLYFNDNILYVTLVGDIDENTAIQIKEVILKIYEENVGEGKINIFVDNNKCGKYVSKARKIFGELFDRKSTGKVAVFSLHSVAKVLTSFFIAVSKKEGMRSFDSKEEALAWLKEDKL